VLFRSSCTDTWLDLRLDGWRNTHAEFVPGSSSSMDKRGKNYFKAALTTASASAAASKTGLPRQDGPRLPLTPFHLQLKCVEGLSMAYTLTASDCGPTIVSQHFRSLIVTVTAQSAPDAPNTSMLRVQLSLCSHSNSLTQKHRAHHDRSGKPGSERGRRLLLFGESLLVSGLSDDYFFIGGGWALFADS
jgi:hypothetical protein